MARVVLVMVAVAALLVASGGAAQARVTGEQLAAAMVTDVDLGPGFVSQPANPLPGPAVHRIAAFQRTSPVFEVVMVILLDAEGASVADVLDMVRYGLTDNLGLSSEVRDSAPPIGAATQRAAISGRIGGIPMQGDLLAWQHGDVTAVMIALSSDPIDAQPYAEAQEAKLGMVLPLDTFNR